MAIDPLDLLDNDFNIIGNRFTDARNIIRKANLSVSQAIQIAKMMTTQEILDNLDKYRYEIDVYNVFSNFLMSLSLSQDAKVVDLLGKVYATQLKESKKDKKGEKLEGE